MKCRVMLLAAALVTLNTAHAQPTSSYPAKPIRIVVPLAPGGNVDLVVRAISQRLSEAGIKLEQ